jgi:CopG family nickel-responsive transcriptional regulator|uniref:Putative nickel-responsive regulator n=1 Tax=candidate division WOR-3 bacterium TaxID=2052148 RepID=A0A7V3PSE8_UNCW3
MNRDQKAEGVERFGISMEPQLLAQFDAELKKAGYSCRSEAVRDLIRSWLASRQLLIREGNAVAALAIAYEHEHRDVVRRLTRIGHRHYAEILFSVHIHLDSHHCLEVLLLRGPVKRIQALADRLSALKGVEQGRVSMIPVNHHNKEDK